MFVACFGQRSGSQSASCRNWSTLVTEGWEQHGVIGSQESVRFSEELERAGSWGLMAEFL